MNNKKKVITIIKNTLGDSLERAERLFGQYTPAQMEELWGDSGQTAQQVLDGYRKRRQEKLDLIKWLQEVL